jgi:hypothetical protein
MPSGQQVDVMVCLSPAQATNQTSIYTYIFPCPQGLKPTYISAYLLNGPPAFTASTPTASPSPAPSTSDFLAAWSIAFSAVITFYIASRFAGTLLGLIKRA